MDGEASPSRPGFDLARFDFTLRLFQPVGVSRSRTPPERSSWLIQRHGAPCREAKQAYQDRQTEFRAAESDESAQNGAHRARERPSTQSRGRVSCLLIARVIS